MKYQTDRMYNLAKKLFLRHICPDEALAPESEHGIDGQDIEEVAR